MGVFLHRRYFLDLYGTKAEVPYTAQGLGIYVSLSTMDKYWYEGIGKEEALEVLKKCMNEAKHRESPPPPPLSFSKPSRRLDDG
jgi:20S proteasome alpha/beta subunit